MSFLKTLLIHRKIFNLLRETWLNETKKTPNFKYKQFPCKCPEQTANGKLKTLICYNVIKKISHISQIIMCTEQRLIFATFSFLLLLDFWRFDLSPQGKLTFQISTIEFVYASCQIYYSQQRGFIILGRRDLFYLHHFTHLHTQTDRTVMNYIVLIAADDTAAIHFPFHIMPSL